jgi:putative colanic acid biosynthesis acetyltransferase WcaF
MNAASPPRSQSPWTLRQRIGRVLWAIVQATAFRCSPHNAYRWRAALLRLFGANLARDVRVRRTVRIEVPWHLTVGEDSAIGDFAIVYSLGPITIGRYVTVSQYAHLCAGTHDATNRRMTLLRPPIRLEDDVWVAADAFVGPGVTVGARTILGARASAFSDLPPDVVAVGNPAKPIKRRDFANGGAAAEREGAGRR